ncbi:hypothetical protein BpHYR1_025015 [Brachionus plicatilis]|uniref:Uncharacterized protein n=1 Tax=Brachionus plicatilis TaxID=10195 RepID=A0A3M7RZ71_BRAPC|nr:hypothetical protein BpHYR1_025015 [Brachionus plicatilis]
MNAEETLRNRVYLYYEKNGALGKKFEKKLLPFIKKSYDLMKKFRKTLSSPIIKKIKHIKSKN